MASVLHLNQVSALVFHRQKASSASALCRTFGATPALVNRTECYLNSKILIDAIHESINLLLIFRVVGNQPICLIVTK